MRKLLTMCVLASSLVLVQCTTTQIQQVETFIGQVQSATAKVCKFIPTVDTIISMVNSGIGMVVGAITTAICNAVPPAASARYKALPRASSGALPAIIKETPPVISGWRVG